MSNIILIAIIIVLVAGFGVLLYLLIVLKNRAEKPVDDGGMKVMMEWMKDMKAAPTSQGGNGGAYLPQPVRPAS